MSFSTAPIDLSLGAAEILLLAICTRGLWILPRIWRGEITFPDRAPSWWFWGQQLWSGFTRAMPAAIILLSLPVVIGVATDLGEGVLGWSSSVSQSSAGIVLALLLVGSVLVALVVLLSHPKLLIAPDRRSEPGAIQTWRSEREKRRVSRNDRN